VVIIYDMWFGFREVVRVNVMVVVMGLGGDQLIGREFFFFFSFPTSWMGMCMYVDEVEARG
jgi:hypothetical protein